MKRLILIVLLALYPVSFVQTQDVEQTEATEELQPLAEELSWLIGNWEGEGLTSENQGKVEFLGKMSVVSDLDQQALVIHRESTNKPGMPIGSNKEIMVVSVDGATKNVIMTLHTSRNFIGIYKGEVKDSEVSFTLATAQEGSVYRRLFKQLTDGALSFTIESGSNGQSPSKQLEINFRKKT